MIFTEQNYLDSPIRRIQGKVELYEGSTLLETFTKTDALKSFTIERAGEEGKFFGFGVVQKLKVNLVDKERQINIDKSHALKPFLGDEGGYVDTNPLFYVSNVKRNENTNELTIEAYDAIYGTAKHNITELNLLPPYTLREVAQSCADFLNVPLEIEVFLDNTSFNTVYETGANLEGSETIRELLNAIAEATQTIYFMNASGALVFKQIDRISEPVLGITKDKYFALTTGNAYTLSGICHATSLGDNVLAGSNSTEPGYVVQYVRDNPFWDMRDDIDVLVEAAFDNTGNAEMTVFDCLWRGNYLLEIGDKIEITAKDNSVYSAYVLNDTLNYTGGFSQHSRWNYTENKNETAANPSTLGEALKQTYAKVDKVNKEVTIVSSQTEANTTDISELKVNTEEIRASVESVNNNIEDVNNDITNLTQRVDATVTATDVNIAIQTEMEKGVDKVTTSTGFTFNEAGLTVSKSNSEMTTQITEDGMSVSRDGDKVLIADNSGVKAENLHATTYLIIGTTSRFEDWNGRTGCFWIGG